MYPRWRNFLKQWEEVAHHIVGIFSVKVAPPISEVIRDNGIRRWSEASRKVTSELLYADSAIYAYKYVKFEDISSAPNRLFSVSSSRWR